jgi:sensor histidine kinase regulating citrate/malate metabolism
MISFKRRSIKLKLRIVVLLTATLGITFASAAFLSYDQIKQRETLTKEMQILSKVVAIRSAVALSFMDKKNALSNLKTLDIKNNFRLGCIYDQSTALFVKSNPKPQFGDCPTQISNFNHNTVMTSDYLDVFQPIIQNNKAIGLVFVRVGLDELYERIQQQIIVSLTILICSLAAAFLFTARLQKQIYNPIIHLGEVAAQVKDNHNYSIRAQKECDDELGDTVETVQ